MHITHVHLDLDRWLLSEGFAIIDGSEPATDADLFSYLGDGVLVFGDIISQFFGLFRIDHRPAFPGFKVALGALGIFVHEAREPAMRDAEALGDGGLGFAGFDAFKDAGIPAALFFDGFENEGFERAGGYGLVSTAQFPFGSQVLAHLLGERFRLGRSLHKFLPHSSGYSEGGASSRRCIHRPELLLGFRRHDLTMGDA